MKKVFKGIQPENFHSLVAFLGTAKFKTLPENTYTSINAVIKELEKHTEPVIGIKTLLLAIGLMEYSRKYDLPETHEEHVAYLKEKHPELKEAA